jgi:3-oxoacyl-[acyl-carrier protein] reductase
MSDYFALVTGGTSGIGFETAKRLAEKGLDLALVYLKDESKAQKSIEELKKINPNIQIELFKCDMSLVHELEKFIELVKQKFSNKKLGYFISCHGQIRSNLFLMKKRKDIENVIQEHLISNVFLTHILLKDMCINQFGKIIFMTSLASKKINRGQSDYALSKSALEVFVKSMTSEYYHRGITFNCVSAGLVDTRLAEGVREAYEGKNKTGSKIINVESVVNLLMVVIEDKFNDISGSTLSLDGGQFCLGNNMDYHKLSHHVSAD